jgi:hypothetical protein
MWLWPPLMQKELDRFQTFANTRKMRKQRDKALPSGVSAAFAYSCPERFGGRNCLQQVDKQVIGEIIADLEPEAKARMDWGVPPELAASAKEIFEDSGVEEVTMNNVWLVFGYILQRLGTQ